MENRKIQNYKIISQIAEGGMGTVFYGEHITLNRPVAIKQLHSNFTNNADFRDRFVNEAMILAQLNHSNIITIYDLIEENGSFYIVMEYVQGDTLDNIMQKFNSPFQTQRAVYVFKQILEAFDYAHKKGIIHRDIKPSNIILEEGDKPKILDFGIAKLVNSNLHLTKAGTRMGSVYYMSPEQVMGYDVDSRSDIYSLGIVLYEMLTRSLPYNIQTDTEYAIMENIMKVEIPNLSSFRSDVDSNLSFAIQKACSKEANMRFSTCSEFLNALSNKGYIYSPPISQNTVVSNTPNYNSTVYSVPSNQQQAVSGGRNKNTLIILLAILIIGIGVALFIVLKGNDSKVVVDNAPSKVTSTNTSTNTSQSQPTTQKTETESAPVQVVRGFITDLGNGDFQSAYNRQKNKAWGAYSHFSSSKGFGGITSTVINSIRINNENSYDASVYVDYTAYDPSNLNGTYYQYFQLNKIGSEWKIVKVTKASEYKTWK